MLEVGRAGHAEACPGSPTTTHCCLPRAAPPSLLAKQLACREQLVPPPRHPSSAATLEQVWSHCLHLRAPCVREAQKAVSLLPGGADGTGWGEPGGAGRLIDSGGRDRVHIRRVGPDPGEGQPPDEMMADVSRAADDREAQESGGLLQGREGGAAGAGREREPRQGTPPVMLLSSGCHDVVSMLVRDSVRMAKPVGRPAPAATAPAGTDPAPARSTAAAGAGIPPVAAVAATAVPAGARVSALQGATAAQRGHPQAGAAPWKNSGGLGAERGRAAGVAKEGAAAAAAAAGVAVAAAGVPQPVVPRAPGPAGRSGPQGKGPPEARPARPTSVQPIRAALRLTTVPHERGS
ncbi:MAG: hypothetical protein WDW36_005884 [Sanguina aurantia]